MPNDILTNPSFARLNAPQELLPWAHRLINDLYQRLFEIANAINELNVMVGPPGQLHNLLSVEHPDTVPATPIRGDLIVGNATPLWARFPVGASGRFLRSDGTDPAWTVIAKADLPASIAYEDETNTFALGQIFNQWLRLDSIPTPSDPPAGTVYLYQNNDGSTAEVRIRFEDGSECVVCTHSLVISTDSLPLNWVE